MIRRSFSTANGGILAAAVINLVNLITSAASAAEILFYSSVPRNLTDTLTKDFEVRNPGMITKTFQAGTETLLEKMELEIRGSGHPAADVVWVQEKSAMERYAASGIFAKYVPQGAEAIDPKYKDKDGYWIGNSVSYIVLMYNYANVADVDKPTGWKDLADPRFKSQTMFADPRVSGTSMTVVSALVQNFGWSFVEAAARNSPQIANGHPAMVSTIIAGERTLSPMQDISIFAATARRQPIGFAFPTEGAVVVPAFIAISSSTRHLDASKKFMDYLVSLDAAEVLRSKGMYHTRADAKAPEGWPTAYTIKTLPFDWNRHNQEKEQIKARFSDLTEKP